MINGLCEMGRGRSVGGKVSAQAIGKYERDEMTPSSGVLLALGKALGVSLAYLMDTQGIELKHVDFRTKANTTGKDRAQVETTVIEWMERYLQIERILELDSAEWDAPISPPRQLATVEEAEGLANEVREKWSLGADPIPNMTELLEEKGLKVLIEELPVRVSGFTCLVKRLGGQADLPVVVVNKNASLERRRLTLAHELAHRVIAPDCLDEKAVEKAATYFAGAFLMPAEHVRREAGKHRSQFGYNELIGLKRLYRASGAALLVRLKNLGIISESSLTYAFQTYARGWRSDEPAQLEVQEERGEREKPHRFERLCYRALAEGLISLDKAAELLRSPIEEVEAGLKGPK
jgi:Zn-dependent peptidase ImmA (M78 family)